MAYRRVILNPNSKLLISSLIMINEDFMKTLAEKLAYCTKEVLTADEVSQYTGLSKSYIYKLTMNRQIPHYKPTGKIVFFNRREIEEWLLSNRVKTESELNTEANQYCRKNR